MLRIKEVWPARLRRTRPARAVYVGSHEDKLSRLAAMHIDADDDGRTREDVHRAKFGAPHLLRPSERR